MNDLRKGLDRLKTVGERTRNLIFMDKYIRDEVQDEDIQMDWLMGGVPDGADFYDLQDIANDDEEYEEIEQFFLKLQFAWVKRTWGIK